MIAILFGSGMTLYAINKYYWHSWSHLNFLEWWGNILFGYLYFLIMQSISIVFWIISSALVTYFIALDDDPKAFAKRPLLILSALYAIFLSLVPRMGQFT
jgi:hypothetical protein